MNNSLLKANQIAERLNISRSQAFALMKNGDLPTVRFGRCVRVRPEDLDAFIEVNITGDIKNLPVAATTSKSGLETPKLKGDYHE